VDRSRRELLTLGLAAAAGSLWSCRETATSRAPAPSTAHLPGKIEIPPPISAARYAQRRNEVAGKMRREGIDALLITPSASLLYLTGADLWRSERLIASVLHEDGRWENLGPAFEADRLRRSGLPGELLTWEEAQDPNPILARLLTQGGSAPKLAVEGTTWFDDLAPLSRILPSARVISATPLLSSFRMKKDPEEIALMRAAGGITLAVIQRLMGEMKEGLTEEGVLRRAGDLSEEWGVALDGMVQFGANSAIPHAASGNAKLTQGQVILFDLGVTVHGYHSDVSRTFAFGKAPPRFQQVYELVKAAQEAGFSAARPGMSAAAVDAAARSVIQKAGFGKDFTHRLGHGLGLQVHEPPYLVEGNSLVLEEGMTVTIEPGIYLSGEFGVRLEDDVRVSPRGAEVLSSDSPGPSPDAGTG
jgi:Xaa-Pro aminopeptidase